MFLKFQPYLQFFLNPSGLFAVRLVAFILYRTLCPSLKLDLAKCFNKLNPFVHVQTKGTNFIELLQKLFLNSSIENNVG